MLDHVVAHDRVEQGVEFGSGEQLVCRHADLARRDREADARVAPSPQGGFHAREDQLGRVGEDAFGESLAVAANRVVHGRGIRGLAEEFGLGTQEQHELLVGTRNAAAHGELYDPVAALDALDLPEQLLERLDQACQ